MSMYYITILPSFHCGDLFPYTIMSFVSPALNLSMMESDGFKGFHTDRVSSVFMAGKITRILRGPFNPKTLEL